MYDVSNLYFFVPRKWLRSNLQETASDQRVAGFYRKRPEKRPSVFAFFLRCDMLGVGECKNDLCLCCLWLTSVDTLHVRLDTSSVLRWTHFMLCWARLLWQRSWMNVANARFSAERKKDWSKKWWKRWADFRAVRLFLFPVDVPCANPLEWAKPWFIGYGWLL